MKNDCGEKQKKPDREESFPGFKFPVDFIFEETQEWSS